MSIINNNKELLVEFKKEFDKWKAESGFNPTFEELDEIFFINDYILVSKFISPKLSRMICGRIRDLYNSWNQQIHSWIIPSPYSMISTSESSVFNDEEKEELNNILKDFMGLVSSNIIIGITKDNEREKEFINQSVILWNKYLPRLIYFSEKVTQYWNKPLDEKSKK